MFLTEYRPVKKVFQPSIFRCEELLVSGRVDCRSPDCAGNTVERLYLFQKTPKEKGSEKKGKERKNNFKT